MTAISGFETAEHGLLARSARLIAARSRTTLVFYAIAILWGGAFAVGAAAAQHSFMLRRYDLGNFTQAVWSTAHGRLLHVTEVGGADVSRLSIHVDPILVALVPLWWIWSSPVMLLAVQAAALAAAAVPLFWLARAHLRSETDAAIIACAYLLCPAVTWNAFHEFHAVALAVPLLVACVWFLDQNRVRPFVLAAGAVVLCQEQLGFVVACLGIWYAFRRGRRGGGVVVLAAAGGGSGPDLPGGPARPACGNPR